MERPFRKIEPAAGEAVEHALGQRLRPLGGVGPGGDGPGAPLPVVERDVLAHPQQIGRGEERIRPQPLRQPLRPRRRRPAQVAHVAAAERRQVLAPLARFFRERGAQAVQRRALQPVAPDADVAVTPQRSLEEERVAFGCCALRAPPVAGEAASSVLVVEKAEDAERRQQVTGQFDGGCSASKAGSGSGSSWPHRNGCARRDQAV